MKLLYLLVVLSLAAFAASMPKQQSITTLLNYYERSSINRIVDGKLAKRNQFPWQVSIELKIDDSTHFCGGSIISPRWILTAAHCAQGASHFKLRIGGLDLSNDNEEGKVIVESTEYFVHPHYDPVYLSHDIALIALHEDLPQAANIKPIGLPDRYEMVYDATSAIVSGWGKTSDHSGLSDQLRYTELVTIKNKECEMWLLGKIAPEVVCCFGKPNSSQSPCSGDSGGPLVVYDDDDDVPTLVGVVSFVSNWGCEEGLPSGYFRTEPYLPWIHEVTGLDV